MAMVVAVDALQVRTVLERGVGTVAAMAKGRVMVGAGGWQAVASPPSHRISDHANQVQTRPLERLPCSRSMYDAHSASHRAQT